MSDVKIRAGGRVAQPRPMAQTNPAAAIERIGRRIAELDAMNQESDPESARWEVLEGHIQEDIRDIFGEGSKPDDDYFARLSIYRPNHSSPFDLDPRELHEERLRCRKLGIHDVRAILDGFKSRLNELTNEVVPATNRTPVTDDLALHPMIFAASGKLLADGHHRDAILRASIALANAVKQKSGSTKDGSGMMFAVFGGDQPSLAFNDLKTTTDKDEQQGLCNLFAGAAMAIRNPRAHDNAPDRRDYALKALAFLSLLAEHLDKAVKR